jgi:hypothetical protein
VELPPVAPVEWRNALTGEQLTLRAARRKKSLPLRSALRRFPLALLTRG